MGDAEHSKGGTQSEQSTRQPELIDHSIAQSKHIEELRKSKKVVSEAWSKLRQTKRERIALGENKDDNKRQSSFRDTGGLTTLKQILRSSWY